MGQKTGRVLHETKSSIRIIMLGYGSRHAGRMWSGAEYIKYIGCCGTCRRKQHGNITSSKRRRCFRRYYKCFHNSSFC